MMGRWVGSLVELPAVFLSAMEGSYWLCYRKGMMR